MKKSTLKFRINPDAKSQFSVFCLQNETSMSEVLNSHIADLLKEDFDIVRFEKDIKDDTVTVRLTSEEKAKLKKYCEAENITYSQALIRQIRILINQEPHFTKDELQVLRNSNNQLVRIGRNLNQVVRKMNADELTSNDMKGDDLKQITKLVDDQNFLVMLLMKKSLSRAVKK